MVSVDNAYMGLQEWIEHAVEKKASAEQIRDSLTNAGYPEDYISHALTYRQQVVGAQHHQQLGYFIVGAGVIVVAFAILTFFFL